MSCEVDRENEGSRAPDRASLTSALPSGPREGKDTINLREKKRVLEGFPPSEAEEEPDLPVAGVDVRQVLLGAWSLGE